jgi:hypothetical protein
VCVGKNEIGTDTAELLETYNLSCSSWRSQAGARLGGYEIGHQIRAPPRRKGHWSVDAFLSYHHTDVDQARHLARSLTHEGFSVWLDRRNVRAGSLLSNAIMEALDECRNIVVLWSRASAKSDWVQLEWTTVFNLNLQKETVVKKGIIPCRLDATPFPPRGVFLVNYPYYDFQQSFDEGLRALVEGLRVKAPKTPRTERYKPSTLVDQITFGQQAVIEALGGGDVGRARALQKALNTKVRTALGQQPSDRYVLTLDGYNKKNQYMIRHWDDLQAGVPPFDPLLERAKRTFLEVLSRYPDDPGALNGVGSVLLFLGDLKGAEFYVRRALTEAKKQHANYAAAEQDLDVIKAVAAWRRRRR